MHFSLYRMAFTVVVLLWLLCAGAMLISLVFFVHADEQAVSRNVRASLLMRSDESKVEEGQEVEKGVELRSTRRE